jgi:hypothetical protein
MLVAGVTTNKDGDGLTDSWPAAVDARNCVVAAASNVIQRSFLTLSVKSRRHRKV